MFVRGWLGLSRSETIVSATFAVACAAVVVAGCSREPKSAQASSIAAAQAGTPVAAGPAPVTCPAPLPSPGLPRALPASLAILRSALPGCLRLFTAAQPSGSQPQPQLVQGIGTCSAGGALIRVTAMQFTGVLTIAQYRQRVGEVVASIENLSDCTSAGVQIPPGGVAYWVIDVETDPKNPNQTVPMSHVIDLVKEADVAGGGPKYLRQCPNEPNPTSKGDLAFFTLTSNPCTHGVMPGTSLSQMLHALPMNSAAFQSLQKIPFDPPATMWIACGVDCCYASDT
jgi:hypothetical protein